MADTSPLYAAMALAFTELEGALKTSNNPHFKSKYADLGNVIDAIKPALAKQGLFFWQVSHDTPDGAMIETVIGHKSGGERSLGKLFIPASKKDAHGFGSALTYARRYALMAAFGIPAEDDDGNAASLGQGKGQSQTGTVSPSPEGPGEPNRQTGVTLSGPHKSITALEKAIKAFVVEMGKVGDMREWYGLKNDNGPLLAQAERDHPDWWNGWPGQPDGFTPLRRKIEILETQLCEAAEQQEAAE